MNSEITYLTPKPITRQQPQRLATRPARGYIQQQQHGYITQDKPGFPEWYVRHPLQGTAVILAGGLGMVIALTLATRTVFSVMPHPYPTSPCTRSISAPANVPLPPPVTPALGIQVAIAETGYQATFPANSVWAEHGGVQFFGEPAQIQRAVNAWDRLKSLPGYEARLAKTKRIWLGQNAADMSGIAVGGGAFIGGQAILIDPYPADDDQVLIGLDHENRHNNGEGHGTINGESLQLADQLGIPQSKIVMAP
jgi:hypothetical protein